MNIEKAIEILESGLITQQEQSELAVLLKNHTQQVKHMNKQIDEIYQQVMDEVCPNPLYRFAELVAAAARLEEREACAKLCDEFAKFFGEKGEYATHELHRREWETLVGCAKAIRGRTE